MRLTQLLLATFRKTAPGNIYRGKNRKWPKVTDIAAENKVRALQLEEQNMFYLRHPYLTLDQSWGHATALGKRKDFVREKWLTKMNSKAKPDVTLEERYAMLRNKDVWD